MTVSPRGFEVPNRWELGSQWPGVMNAGARASAAKVGARSAR